jgi:integrase/recombinase XerC
MSVMRGLGDFLVREKLWPKNPLRWLRGPKLSSRRLVPRRIESSRLWQLVELTGQGRGSYHRCLWLTVLMLLYGTGLRRGELERLDVDDWQREEGLLRIDGRKTGRERLVPVPEIAVQCLERYLVDRHNHLERLGQLGQRSLLVSREGGRLKGTAISLAVQRLARSGGLGRITLHQFRHTCASDLLEAGRHLAEVQQILGHATISTTMRYLHIADPQRHEAARRHPINQMLSGRPAAAAEQVLISQGVEL